MPKPTKFDANKLREMIAENKTAQEILDHFEIKKPMLKNYLSKLMMLDKQFYEIEGLSSRAVSSSLTVNKLGLRIGSSLLSSYGFSAGDAFKFSVVDGDIVLKKITD